MVSFYFYISDICEHWCTSLVIKYVVISEILKSFNLNLLFWVTSCCLPSCPGEDKPSRWDSWPRKHQSRGQPGRLHSPLCHLRCTARCQVYCTYTHICGWCGKEQHIQMNIPDINTESDVICCVCLIAGVRHEMWPAAHLAWGTGPGWGGLSWLPRHTGGWGRKYPHTEEHWA